MTRLGPGAALRRRPRDERGIVAVLVAVLTLFLVVMLAMITDVGMAYAQKSALATGADSAALAVSRSQYKLQIKNPTRSCQAAVAADTALTSTDPAKSTNVGLAQVNLNAPYGATLTASQVTTSLTCVRPSTGVACNASAAVDPVCIMRVSVTANKDVSRIFGKIAGAAPIPVTRAATAAIGVRNNPDHVMPIGLCKFQAQQIAANAAATPTGTPYPGELITLEKVWTGNNTCDGGGGAGNWGWLDLGQGNGANALGDLLAAGGTSTEVSLTGNPPSLTVGGSPGNKGVNANVHTGMALVMDKTVLMPVYDTFVGNGNNATYHIVGFMTVKVCGYDNAQFGSCYDPTKPMTGNDMQVRFVTYSTVGDIMDNGGFGANSFDNYVIGMTN